MGREQHQRILAVQCSKGAHLVVVGEHVVGPDEPPAEPAPSVLGPFVVRGRKPTQMRGRLRLDRFDVTAEPVG
jgi:hypothetical protein